VADADAPDDEARARRREGGSGLLAVGAGLVVWVLASTLATSLVVAAKGLRAEQAPHDLAVQAVGAVAGLLGFVGVPFAWAARRGGPARALGVAARPVDAPLGVAVGLLASGVVTLVTWLALTGAQRHDLDQKARDLVDPAHGVGVAVIVVVLCVLAPLGEEVFFRGLLYPSLRKVLGVVAGAVIAGSLFGVLHWSGGAAAVVLSQLGLLSAFGIVLCLLRERTGRLGAGLAAHATFNLVSVVALFWSR
jgi:membrane protease YdiL (CAAX protease family)